MADVPARYLLPDASVLPKALRFFATHASRFDEASTARLRDRYLDTAHLAIMNSGWTYRWRQTSNGRTVSLLPLVTARGRPAEQEEQEIEASVPSFPDDVTVLPNPSIRERLSHLNLQNLQTHFRTDCQRRTFELCTDKGDLADLVVEQTVIKTRLRKGGARRLDFVEIELTPRTADREAFNELAERARQALNLIPSRLSNFERAVRLNRACLAQLPPAPSELLDSEFVEDLRNRSLEKRDPASRLAYQYLMSQLEAMLLVEPTAWEGIDIEGVHRMRVAIRRIRAGLRTFEPVLPATAKDLRRDFKWLAAELGSVRDLDVACTNFSRLVRRLSSKHRRQLTHFYESLNHRRREAKHNLVTCLSGQRYQNLARGFAKFLRLGANPDASTNITTIDEFSRAVIRKQYQKVLAGGQSIQRDSPANAYHSLRIECKKFRYQLEIARPVYRNELRATLKHVRKLQQPLGDFQDAYVAKQLVRNYREQARSAKRAERVALRKLMQTLKQQGCDQQRKFRRAWKKFRHKSINKRFARWLTK